MKPKYHIYTTDYFTDSVKYEKLYKEFDDEESAIKYVEDISKTTGLYYFIIKCYKD
jgi:hypothetical protein